MNNAKISVIIPVYNAEKYLCRCIESVLRQTYTDIEVLLVNDGSTDGSLKICEEFSKKDTRVRVFSQSNSGVSAARNTGLNHAEGEYIGFIDSDDCISPLFYEKLYEAIQTAQTDVVDSRQQVFYDERILDQYAYKTHSDQYAMISVVTDRAEMLRTYWDMNQFTWSVTTKLIKRKVLEGLRFSGNNGEDTKLILNLIDRGASFALTDIAMYYYFKGNDHSLTSVFTKKTLDIFDYYDLFRHLFQQYGMDDMEEKVAAKIAQLKLNYCARVKYSGIPDKKALLLQYQRELMDEKVRILHNPYLNKVVKLNYIVFCKAEWIMCPINFLIGRILDLRRSMIAQMQRVKELHQIGMLEKG